MDSTVRLRDGMAFDCEVGDHTIVIDAKAEHGGTDRGPSPKNLVLTALAGCAAMDVISILRKMRAEPASLDVSATAELTDDHPKVFTDMTVRVAVTGDVPPKKLWKAVALSRDRYCGVAAMLRAHGPIRYVVTLEGVEIPEEG
ncbi:MAG: OsmC family protein [Myxococcota bacterium]